MNSVHGAVGGEEPPTPPPPENDFHRLPDEIVIDIFNKVSEAKYLCRCFVVSRRFSLLIPSVQTVSVASTSWISIPNANSSSKSKSKSKSISIFGFIPSVRKFSLFPDKPLHGLVPLPPSPSEFRVLNFLSKLTQIRSLQLELPSKDLGGKWGAKFTPQLHSVTLLYPTFIYKFYRPENQPGALYRFEERRRVAVATRCVTDALFWQAVLCHVVHECPMLESVSIVDSNEMGVKVCLGGEKLVEWRNSENLSTLDLLAKGDQVWKPENLRVGYVPMLNVPVSGCLMKGLTIVKFKVFGDGDPDDDSAMLDAFAEEEGAFSEAVSVILANHQDSIVPYDFY